MSNSSTRAEIFGKAQKEGMLKKMLSQIVLPPVAAFLTWGLVAVLFSPSGILPSMELSELHEQMIRFLLPLLVSYLSGHLVHEVRGGVIATIAVMGATANVPAKPVALAAMLILAVIIGIISAFCMKKIDGFLEDKISVGFEMLVNNYSIGILGMILATLAYGTVGPAMTRLIGA